MFVLLLLAVSSCLSPVLIIPGDGGNALEAKLSDRKNTPHFYCSKNSDWYRIWLDVKLLSPGVADCWCENMKVSYDPATNKYSNNQGV